MRSDATRNRGRILAAARALVAERGADAGMDAIAAEAGVAVGTLYRHYPTKADLVAAVVDDSVRRIADAAEESRRRVDAGADPVAELAELFRAVAERHAADRALKAALAALGAPARTDPATSPVGSPAHRVGAALDAMLDTARAGGQVRADLRVDDLVLLLAGVPDGATPARDRYLELVLAGVRAR